jgi:hypothetical protein
VANNNESPEQRAARQRRVQARHPGIYEGSGSSDRTAVRDPQPVTDPTQVRNFPERTLDGEPRTARLVPIQPPPPLPEEWPEIPAPPDGYCYDMMGQLRPVVSGVSLRTRDGQDVFCHVLELTGSLQRAQDACGVRSRTSVVAALEADPEFGERVWQAQERHKSLIYEAAHRRAVYGWDTPIIGGKNKDEIVGYERRFSDQIMIKMLGRWFPEFNVSPAKPIQSATGSDAPQGPPPVDVSSLSKSQRAHLRAFLTEAAQLPPEDKETP